MCFRGECGSHQLRHELRVLEQLPGDVLPVRGSLCGQAPAAARQAGAHPLQQRQAAVGQLQAARQASQPGGEGRRQLGGAADGTGAGVEAPEGFLQLVQQLWHRGCEATAATHIHDAHTSGNLYHVTHTEATSTFKIKRVFSRFPKAR